MKKSILLLFSIFLSSFAFSQLNMSLVGNIDFAADLSDVWGYAAPDGTEYAIVGLRNGTSVVSLADPSNPTEVAFIPGPSTTWRDIKVWKDFAYVINETANGLHVLDLSGLPDNVEAEFWAPSLPVGGTLNTCHNIWIDEFGVAYLSGCNVNSGGLIYADVDTDPGNPIYLGAAPASYSHDVYVRDNLAYDAQISSGNLVILDVSDKSNTQVLGSQATPFNATHNTWLTDDSQVVFTTDETGDAPVASYDISDPSDIKELDQFRPLETLGEGVVPHNVHVWNDFLIISYYTDGCILVDAARPHNLVEVGNFDTYTQQGAGFEGAWGAYPFLPSGLVLVSDISNGLFVLEPNYVRACYLEGNVTDASNGAALFGAEVDIIDELAFESTDLFGAYATGLPTSGSFDVEFSKAGYLPKIVSVELENGVVTDLDVELEPLPSFVFNGKVIDAETGEGVDEALVKIQNDDFSFDITTDANGDFTINSFFEGNYEVIADKWGYRANLIASSDFDENNSSIEIEIEQGIEDVFSLDKGWELSGTAFQGEFELGDPIGVVPAQLPVEIQPEDDVDEDIGNSCYITGNTTDLFGGVQIDGITRITSPVFDLSDMNVPTITYSYWVFTFNLNTNSPSSDRILVKLNNGTQTITVAEHGYTDLMTPPSWQSNSIVVSDFIEPSETMQISFEAGDNDPGGSDVMEAGIDYFQAFDAMPPSSLFNQFDESISLIAAPNPSTNEFLISYEFENSNSEAKLMIFNALGQIVEVENLDGLSGNIRVGEELESGVYLAKIEQDGRSSKAIRLVKQ